MTSPSSHFADALGACQDKLARHRIRQAPPLEEGFAKDWVAWVFGVGMVLAIGVFVCMCLGAADGLFKPSALANGTVKIGLRFLCGVLASVLWLMIWLAISHVLASGAQEVLVWRRGMALDTAQARFIAEFSQEQPWVGERVVKWLAATSHQRLSTREHDLLRKVRKMLGQAKKEDERMAMLREQAQHVESILDEHDLVSQARVERQGEILAKHTPPSQGPKARGTRL